MSKLTKITSLLAISAMLGGVGVSSTTAFASDSSSIRTVQPSFSKKDKKSHHANSNKHTQSKMSHTPGDKAFGLIGKFQTLANGYNNSYSGGVKFGKWLKKNHPTINKEFRSHPTMLTFTGTVTTMFGGAFISGYLKGSK